MSRVPANVDSDAPEALALAAEAGLILDPWQRLALEGALGLRVDGRWSAPDVALIVPRQSGKGAVLEARALAGLFLCGERLILWSAHEFKTAKEAYLRVRALIEGCPPLAERVLKFYASNESHEVILRDGARLKFVARSSGSGRGFSGDLVILDEAYALTEDQMAALLPTLSARPNPQLWYTSSAPLPTSTVLWDVVRRGRAGSDPTLAYYEWSAADADDPLDVDRIAAANPGLGIRIALETVLREQRALSPESFARERLGVAPDPGDGETADRPIDPSTWGSLADRSSSIDGPLVLGVDVATGSTRSAIVAAGRRSDGLAHVELVAAEPGTGWVAGVLTGLIERHHPREVVLDPRGPAAALIADLRTAGIVIREAKAVEVTQWCAWLAQAASTGQLHHLGQPEMTSAVDAARRRLMGDAWTISRTTSVGDVSPLMAAVLAHGALVGVAEVVPVFAY